VCGSLKYKLFHAISRDSLVICSCANGSQHSSPVLSCAARVGVVLMQGGHPSAFLGKALGPKSRELSIDEKEFMAILLVVQQW
jgi:hypothetical protein